MSMVKSSITNGYVADVRHVRKPTALPVTRQSAPQLPDSPIRRHGFLWTQENQQDREHVDALIHMRQIGIERLYVSAVQTHAEEVDYNMSVGAVVRMNGVLQDIPRDSAAYPIVHELFTRSAACIADAKDERGATQHMTMMAIAQRTRIYER